MVGEAISKIKDLKLSIYLTINYKVKSMIKMHNI